MNITGHFTWKEFKCHNGTDVPDNLKPNVIKLCNNLETLRSYINKPINIVSGYRTKDYNNNLRGKSHNVAQSSQHIQGKAADIKVDGITQEYLRDIIILLIKDKKMINGGIGIYNGWIHYDIRSKPARWDNR